MKTAFTTIFGAAMAFISMGYAAHTDNQSDSTTQPKAHESCDCGPVNRKIAPCSNVDSQDI